MSTRHEYESKLKMNNPKNRPHATIILATSADGKIADVEKSAARFGSANDKKHLEKQIATADAVLFGGGTLRAYGTTMRITSTQLLETREKLGKPSQPAQIVCSRSLDLDPNFPFFQQPVPRWLLTSTKTENIESNPLKNKFEKIIFAANEEGKIDWDRAFQQLLDLGIKRLAILGGGQIVGSLITANLIDELWLTICPLILGGTDAPTTVEGTGFIASMAPRLQLLEVETIGQEVFLHYGRI
jgi:5-amino-6-(5-phosphoribosylamino)uracil reductase